MLDYTLRLTITSLSICQQESSALARGTMIQEKEQCHKKARTGGNREVISFANR